MRISTIDIGTNTILMLIAEPDPKTGQVRTIRDILSIPRLGKGVDSNRNITPVSFEKAAVILKEYKMISDESKSSKVIAAATSFIRDSANRNEFISKIKDETGIEIEILSGSDEARWTFWGGTYDKYQRTKDDGRRVGRIFVPERREAAGHLKTGRPATVAEPRSAGEDTRWPSWHCSCSNTD